MAKDGPGDMAPRAQIPTMVSQAVRFISITLAKSVSVVQRGALGKGDQSAPDPLVLVTDLNEQTVDVILTEENKAQYPAVLLVDKGFVQR